MTKEIIPFEVVGITTSYDEWLANSVSQIVAGKVGPINMNRECINFAERQQLFMLSPCALLGPKTYIAVSKIFDRLEDVYIDGPLHQVYTIPDENGIISYTVRYGQ